MRAIATSVAEYLSSSYHPDVDYVEGELEERNVGRKSHSRTRARLLRVLAGATDQRGYHVYPELRLRVREDRYRISDLCLFLSEPAEEVPSEPPFLCIEVLSPDDSFSRIQQRIDDYFEMGVMFVWVVDPEDRLAWVLTRSQQHLLKTGQLRTASPDIAIDLATLFE